jgi:hypothetical protein
MKEIVSKFLDDQYRFTLSTYSSYMLQDRYTKKDVYLRTVFENLKVIFGIEDDELQDIWDFWADKKIIELNNRITDIRYKIFEITGQDVEVGINEINAVLSKDDLEQIIRMNE